MKKQNNFPDSENTRLDENIKKVMQKDFPLPEKMERAQAEAFAKIKEMQTQKRAEESRKVVEIKAAEAEKMAKKRRKHGGFFKTCMGLAAAAAAFSGVCIVNPAFAAQVPLVGHVFEEIGESLGFSGDYSKYAEPLTEGDETLSDTKAADTETTGTNSVTVNGVTITLSEAYCNDAAISVSLIAKSEEKFPETFVSQDGFPIVSFMRAKIKFSYNSRELNLDDGNLEGKFIDEYTYAGALRFDLSHTTDETDYDGYYEDLKAFALSKGVSGQSLEDDGVKANEELAEILGVEELSDDDIINAGGPDLNDYRKIVEVPDSFNVELSIPQLIGYKPDAEMPEMPQELRAEYEQAMKDNGLSTEDSAYESFTEEQKEIEHQLFTKMMNAYNERFPETTKYPNSYENWWIDGPWDFSFEVNKNDSETIKIDINDRDENGLGLVSVSRTPFEVMVDAGSPNGDYYVTVLDANGEPMETNGGGSVMSYAIQDRDVSRVDVYICDYLEYMDELKGYYWSSDYEEKKKEKTYKQLLDERAVYHKEVAFEE